jgi:hypothetical protein
MNHLSRRDFVGAVGTGAAQRATPNAPSADDDRNPI